MGQTQVELEALKLVTNDSNLSCFEKICEPGSHCPRCSVPGSLTCNLFTSVAPPVAGSNMSLWVGLSLSERLDTRCVDAGAAQMHACGVEWSGAFVKPRWRELQESPAHQRWALGAIEC